MAIRTYKVTLDTKNSIAPEPVLLRQGDKTGAVVIDATLMDNGSPVSLSGLTPSFMANTADGQAVVSDTSGFVIVNASGGEFTYQVPSQLGSVDGKIKIAYFSFSDSSGTQSTFNVVFVVEKAVDMTQEHAKDWVSTLSEIIEQYNQWSNDAHSSWEQFVNENKEIIESIDPGGKVLSELIDFRHSDMLSKTFDTAKLRGDFFDNDLRDRGVNVKWFGAVGDGVTDDTVAFTEAYSIAKANATTVFVPSGRYAVAFDESNKPDNLRFWGYGQINNNGVPFQISTNQNLGINADLQNPFSVSRKTFGRYNSAAAASVIANSSTGKSAVMGINDESTGLENYDNRDSVGLYVNNSTNGLIITTDTVGFGINYVDVNPETDLTNVEVGMFVDTSETPKKTGIVKGITGNRITVNKWIAFRDGADNQVPAIGSSVIINPLTAIWGQNTLVTLDADQTSVAAVGHELDMQNNQPHRDNVDAYIAISMGKYPGNAAYTAKSAGGGNWRYGLYSKGSETGLYHEGGSDGVRVSSAKYSGFSVNDTPISFFSVGQPTDLLIHSTDDDGNALFQIKKSGELSKLILARALTSGTSSAPVIFATGDITLPDPSKSVNEIKLIMNTTSANVKITAPINLNGSVLQQIAIKPHKSLAFVCDASSYYLIDFYSAIV